MRIVLNNLAYKKMIDSFRLEFTELNGLGINELRKMNLLEIEKEL